MLRAPSRAGAAVEGRFVCATGVGMPSRQWSPRPAQGRGSKAPFARRDVGPSRPLSSSALFPSDHFPPLPPAQRLHSPALHDPHAAAHGRSVVGREHHARPGLGARRSASSGLLQEGLACGALPCAPGGGRRCCVGGVAGGRKASESCRRKGLGGRGAGRASAAAARGGSGSRNGNASSPAHGARMHTRTRAYNGRAWLLVRAIAMWELGLVTLMLRLL